MSRFQDNIEAELNDIDWSSIITKAMEITVNFLA